MKKRIVLLVATTLIAASCFAGCTDKKPAETSEQTNEVVETSAFETEQIIETTQTTFVETSAVQPSEEASGIPQPGDTYNGHTVDHTEDQPNCDDPNHGTIWIFYTDIDQVDYIEY